MSLKNTKSQCLIGAMVLTVLEDEVQIVRKSRRHAFRSLTWRVLEENRHVVTRHRLQHHDSIVNLDITPQTDPRNVSHKSKFRSLFTAADEPRNRRKSVRDRNNALPLSDVLRSNLTNDVRETRRDSTHTLPLSPPLTPLSAMSSDPIHAPFEPATELPTPLPVVPPSPYDPLQTPSFRHSPPRLPSDQPWRFPSPSHPLHSRARELSLSMLIREANTPMLKGLPVFGASPGIVQSSPAPTSRVFNGKRSIFEVDTPESIVKSSDPSPRALFLRDQPPTPFRARISSAKARHRIAESPLHRNSSSTGSGHGRSESVDDWFSEVSLMSSTSNLGTSELLTNGDPFVTMYSSWESIPNRECAKPQEFPSSPLSGPETESPVLRNPTLPSGVGLGIGLLGPFCLPEDTQGPSSDLDGDFTGVLAYPPLAEECGKITSLIAVDNIKANCRATSPPTKKRKMTIDSLD